jgi:hypothetical protein
VVLVGCGGRLKERLGGCVRTNEHLVLQVEAELHVLTCPETKVGFGVRELKGVGSCIGGDALAVYELDRNPAVFLKDAMSEAVR